MNRTQINPWSWRPARLLAGMESGRRTDHPLHWYRAIRLCGAGIETTSCPTVANWAESGSARSDRPAIPTDRLSNADRAYDPGRGGVRNSLACRTE